MLFSFLENTKEITIIAHKNPDLDTLCAAQSLYNILKQALKINLVCSDLIPTQYETIIKSDNWIKYIPKTAQKIITLDCSNWERTGLEAKDQYTILNFDHHNTNSNFGNYNYVIKDASSTCEMLAEVIFRYNISISQNTATLLLKEVIKNIRPKFSSTQLKKIGTLLTQTYINKANVAICVQNGNHDKDHKETIIKLIDQIPNTKFSMLLTRNHKGILRASLRSNNSNTDVSKIAQKFGGGGHKKAAGFVCDQSKIKTLRN